MSDPQEKSILVVDDEEIIRSFLAEVLGEQYQIAEHQVQAEERGDGPPSTGEVITRHPF